MTEVERIEAPARRTDWDFPAFDERTVLTSMLDYARLTVHAKCEGLSDEDARRAPLPTSPRTSIASFVSHLRWVEHSWIEVRMLGRADRGPWTDEDPDLDFDVAPDVSLAQLLDEYADQCARNRAGIAALDLDTQSIGRRRSGRTVNLRWVLHHLVEETARHNGHLDILRELADGTTGD